MKWCVQYFRHSLKVCLWWLFSGSDLPPSYDIAAKLPTYEEAERVKELHEDLVSHTWRYAQKCTSLAIWQNFANSSNPWFQHGWLLHVRVELICISLESSRNFAKFVTVLKTAKIVNSIARFCQNCQIHHCVLFWT